MIKNFQESDFIDAFQDLPIYIGNDQSGEMIFKREYSNGLSLTTYLDIYGEKIELTISYPGQNITTFSSHIERVEIKSNVIHCIYLDKCVAELQIEPHLFLKVLGYHSKYRTRHRPSHPGAGHRSAVDREKGTCTIWMMYPEMPPNRGNRR